MIPLQSFEEKELALRSIQFAGASVVSRLVINADEKHYKKGEVIYEQDTKPDAFYIVMKGSVIPDKDANKQTISEKEFFGEEAILSMENYLTTMRAQTDCILLVINQESFWEVVEESDREKVEKEFFTHLIQKTNKNVSVAFKESKKKTPLTKKDFLIQSLGWGLSTLSPILIFELLSNTTIPQQTIVFLAVISSLSFISVFSLVPEFAAMILAVFVFLAGGIVPSQTILSGFGSSSFIMVLGFFALSSILISSGILYRIMLLILNILPNRLIYSNLFLFFIGVFLSLGVPNLYIRSDISKNFFLDIQRIANVQKNSKTMSSLLFSAFTGASIFSQCILTASMTHFIILGLFWGQYVNEFNWIGWLKASLVPMLILFVGYILTLTLFFRDKTPFKINKDLLTIQSNLLGKIRTKELAAILSLAISTLGIVTTQFHGIAPSNILLFILIVMMVFDFLTTKSFQQRIRWDLLLYFAALSGIISTGAAVGMVEWLNVEAKWLVDIMRHNFSYFIVGLVGFIIFLKFLLPRDIVSNFLCVVFVPLAQKNGINPWIMAFIIFTASRIWFFPFQDIEFNRVKLAVIEKAPFLTKDIVKAQFFNSIFYILAIIGGVYYWRYLGILPW